MKIINNKLYLKIYIYYINSMTNNENKNILNSKLGQLPDYLKDIYHNFYVNLNIDLKKSIKRMQWRRACKKYRTENKEKHTIAHNKGMKKYYNSNKEYRQKQSNRYKLRYQCDEEYKTKIKEQALNHYYNKINKSRALPTLEHNNLIIQAF